MKPTASETELTTDDRARPALERVRARLIELDARESAPIAIVGMACRLPGAVRTPEDYWGLLRRGEHAVTSIPLGRWDAEGMYDPDASAPGKSYVRHGGFLDDVDLFDADVFGISPREAQQMDPQQRILLEETRNALEDSGDLCPELMGSRTGVFVGMSTHDYERRHLTHPDASRVDVHSLTGSAASMASGRVAYLFGLGGPAMTVDTACSSSLLAVHLACLSLRDGTCDLAIAAGVNLLLDPAVSMALCRTRAVSRQGVCRAFDASADGFVRSEGCAVVVLRRLERALERGDRVHAVIRGSASNNDGRSSGLTAPNKGAQERLVRDALGASRVHPDDIGYVEAHGTGTPLGDPIEFGALASVFGGRTPDRPPLVVGSVKTNLGHLEAAAGIAGLIKLALCVKHGTIPRQLHFRQRNPHLGFESAPLRIADTETAWAPGYMRRIGGVSAFGFSGTNVHVIVEQPPANPEATRVGPANSGLLTLSAQSESALRRLAAAYGARVLADEAIDIASLCHSANTGRWPMPVRSSIVARDRPQLIEALASLADGRCRVASPPARPARVAWLFRGRGAGDDAVTRQLLVDCAVFRTTFQALDEAHERVVGASLLGMLQSERGLPAEHVTAGLLVVQLSLAAVWRSWGIEPFAVAGDDRGEIAAACFAGVMTPEDAFALVGGLEGVDDADRPLDRTPTHDSQTEPRVAIYSTHLGRMLHRKEACRAASWLRLARHPNSVEASIRAALADGVDTFLELAPGSSLLDVGRRVAPGTDISWLPSTDTARSDEAFRGLLEALGGLFERGVAWSPKGLASEQGGGRRTTLPTYPFERRRYWMEAATSRALASAPPPWFALQELESPALAGPTYSTQVDLSRAPLVADHIVQGRAIVNLVVYLTWITTALRSAFDEPCEEITDVDVTEALDLSDGTLHDVQVLLKGDGERASFNVVSRPAGTRGAWTRHLTGQCTLRASAMQWRSPPAERPREGVPYDLDAFYERLARKGVCLGPACRGLTGLWLHDAVAVGHLVPASTPSPEEPPDLPPSLVDAAFQVVMLPAIDDDASRIIVGFERLRLHGSLREGAMVWATLRPAAGGDALGEMHVLDGRGHMLVDCEGIRLKRLSRPRPATTGPAARAGDASARNEGATAAPRSLEERLAGIVRDVLHLEVPLGSETPLMQLGLDSFMGMELVERIQRAHGVRLPLVSLLEDATLTSVVEAVKQRSVLVQSSAAVPAASDDRTREEGAI